MPEQLSISPLMYAVPTLAKTALEPLIPVMREPGSMVISPPMVQTAWPLVYPWLLGFCPSLVITLPFFMISSLWPSMFTALMPPKCCSVQPSSRITVHLYVLAGSLYRETMPSWTLAWLAEVSAGAVGWSEKLVPSWRKLSSRMMLAKVTVVPAMSGCASNMAGLYQDRAASLVAAKPLCRVTV